MVEPIARTKTEFIGVNPSLPRQTPKTRSFSDAVKKGSSAMLKAVGGASTVLPGGGLLAAAVRVGQGIQSAVSSGAASSGSSAGEDPKAPDGTLQETGSDGLSDFWKLQQEGALMNMEFLKIQESISRENRIFSTISNILKARHETTRNAINNIR